LPVPAHRSRPRYSFSVNVFFRPPAEMFLPAFTTSGGRDGRAPRGPQNRATPWRATEEASAFPLESGRLALRSRCGEAWASDAENESMSRAEARRTQRDSLPVPRPRHSTWTLDVPCWILDIQLFIPGLALSGGRDGRAPRPIAPRRGALQKRQARSHWRADGPGRRRIKQANIQGIR